jgi:hypothetical protein
MIASLICVVSIAAFAHFFVSYTRTTLIATGAVELSAHVRQVLGIAEDKIGGADFGRLLQLVHLCPERHEDQAEIRAVGVYYFVLHLLDSHVRPLVPRISAWLENERRSCSYFAAVALDRRIAHNLSLYGREIAEGL